MFGTKRVEKTSALIRRTGGLDFVSVMYTKYRLVLVDILEPPTQEKALGKTLSWDPLPGNKSTGGGGSPGTTRMAPAGSSKDETEYSLQLPGTGVKR
jgi:hypothetical protein